MAPYEYDSETEDISLVFTLGIGLLVAGGWAFMMGPGVSLGIVLLVVAAGLIWIETFGFHRSVHAVGRFFYVCLVVVGLTAMMLFSLVAEIPYRIRRFF